MFLQFLRNGYVSLLQCFSEKERGMLKATNGSMSNQINGIFPPTFLCLRSGQCPKWQS